MRYPKVLFLALFIIPAIGFSQSDITLVRTPSISPDGTTVAFSYQGDIWKMPINGGEPRRLTIHEAHEINPIWSPDGQSIAFTSNRWGNSDIYTTSKDGGAPFRVTYHSSNDVLSDWAKNNAILFSSSRAYRQIEWDSEIHSVSASGGTPVRYLDAIGEMASMSPNGNLVAFVRGSCRISREDYKGPADMEVWIYNVKTEQYTRITENETNDYMPRWADDNTLFFIGVSSGRYNLHSFKINGDGTAQGTPTALTSYKDEGVRHFDVKNNVAVFERDTRIYKMSVGGTPQAMSIDIKADYRFDPIEKRTFSNGINNYRVSPNNKLVAMVIRGEVFVKENDKEKRRAVNISNHAYRDQGVAWINDSTLLFTSDRNGQYDLYLAKSGDPNKTDIFKTLKYELVRLTKTDENEFSPVISPDKKKVVFRRGRGKLLTADIEDGKLKNEKVLLDGWSTPSGVSWSPDSKWLSYAISDLTFNSDIYIHAADNSQKPVNVSMHPRRDRSPFWSEDGSKLAFVSNRNNGDDDIWFVWLKREDWEKTQRDRDEGYYFDSEEKKEGNGNGNGKGKKGKKKEVKPIQIDFADIHDRLRQVTSRPGNEGAPVVSKDGERIYFTAGSDVSNGRDLYSVKWNGRETKELTKGGQNPYGISLEPTGNALYILKRGSLSKLDAKSGKATPLSHSAKMSIDHQQEREQVFEEAWSALNEGFYDPDFHGQNWKELKKKYKQWAMAASTSQDFYYICNLMLGQLNASHMGLIGGNDEKTQRESTGRLGIEVAPEKGGVKVTHIVPYTPADRVKSKLYVGDVITAVNGQKMASNTNFYGLLADETDDQVLLEVKGTDGKSREVVIRPSRSINNQLYEEWIKEKQELTEKYSNGRLGYIHIRGMNLPSFERFERELMASGLGKDGIVIDVRYNGGGWTTDYLMAVLNVKQHAYTIPRGAAKSLDENKDFNQFYPYSERLPLSAWTKPSIAMCNESSYSNAEIFSHAYKTLGIGTLVGMPTFGAVISTGGQGLLDGSFVRMPFRAWYVKATGENMENGPAVPDVIIDNPPASRAKGEDAQLKKSVELLLQQIDSK
ncbi:MAG: S41 family peptidase [Bacteroidota bacterium]